MVIAIVLVIVIDERDREEENGFSLKIVRMRVLYAILRSEAIHECFGIVPCGEQPNAPGARATFGLRSQTLGTNLTTLRTGVSRNLIMMLHDSV